jgi:hypothetical protein
MNAGSLLPLCALLLCACPGYGGIKLTDDTGGDGVGSLVVQPANLDFGEVDLGDLATGSVTLGNQGELTLNVASVAVTEGVSFALLNDETTFALDPGASRELVFAFEPITAGELTGAALVTSDDPDRPEIPIGLLGTGLGADLAWDPASVDLGELPLGCSSEAALTLRNTGAVAAEVDSLELELLAGWGFELVGTPSLPAAIQPGLALEIAVSFTPEAEGVHTAQLVAGTAEGEEIVAALAGTGVEAATVSDRFTVADMPVDILFSADQSGSMDDDLASLARAFETYITALEGITTDWHVLVANGDDGCSDTGTLGPTSPAYASTFSSAIRSGGGYYTESLLTVAAEALSETGGGGCNAGFLRDEALLHVILVSDEPEQSATGWETNVGRIQAAKDWEQQTRISAVAGDYPAGCGSASAGTGYYEATQATGGAFLSICDGWSGNMNLLAHVSAWGWRFELSQEPLPETIVLRVDDVVLGEGWSWDATSGAVIMEQAYFVEPGADVRVEYMPVGACG